MRSSIRTTSASRRSRSSPSAARSSPPPSCASPRPSATTARARCRSCSATSCLSLAPSPSYADRIRQFNERAGDAAAQSPSELLREFADGNIAALQHLNETTRQADLERGVRMIAEAEAVYLVGLRRSFPVAAYLAYALRHADKRAYLVDGLAGMMVEQSSMLDPKDLLIATSFRPYAQQTAEIVNDAHERGARSSPSATAGSRRSRAMPTSASRSRMRKCASSAR